MLISMKRINAHIEISISAISRLLSGMTGDLQILTADSGALQRCDLASYNPGRKLHIEC